MAALHNGIDRRQTSGGSADNSSSSNLKESCKYLLVTAKNLLTTNEISSIQHTFLKELIFSYDEGLYASLHTTTQVQEYLLQYTKKLYLALFEHLTLEQAHIIATTYADEMSDSTTDPRALVYGEIEFDSFAEVLKVATDGLSQQQKFIDLGHGIGRAVIVAALMCDFKEYHGIEILRGLYETSLGVVSKFRRSICPLIAKAPPAVCFTHGSFLAEPHASSWTDADLVFANSTCFPDELIAEIATSCASLRVGARVITFTTSLRSEYFKVKHLVPFSLSRHPHCRALRSSTRSVCSCRGGRPQSSSTRGCLTLRSSRGSSTDTRPLSGRSHRCRCRCPL
jgi:hypothetical protein